MVECANGCGNMKSTELEGITLDHCSRCSGVWLDSSELTALVETREKTWSKRKIDAALNETGETGVPAHERERLLTCPKCQADMKPVNYQYSSGIILDRCPAGHGVWLDTGELDKIQIYMENWLQQADDTSVDLAAVKAEQLARFRAMSKDGPSRFQVLNTFVNNLFQGLL